MDVQHLDKIGLLDHASWVARAGRSPKEGECRGCLGEAEEQPDDGQMVPLPILDKEKIARYARQRLEQHFGVRGVPKDAVEEEVADLSGEPIENAFHYGGWDDLLRLVYQDRRPLHLWGPDPTADHPENLHDRSRANKFEYVRLLQW